MLIKFLQDVTVRDRTKRHYQKGCIIEMAADSCRHFVSRKKAVFVDVPKVEKPVCEAPVVETVEEIIEESVEEVIETPVSKKVKNAGNSHVSIS